MIRIRQSTDDRIDDRAKTAVMPFKTLRTSVQTVAANDEVTVLFESGGKRPFI